MKAHLSSFVLIALLACEAHAAGSVTEKRTWTETYPVTAAVPRLLIHNIWGSVRVRAGAAGEIAVTVDERRSAPSQEWLEQSKQTLYLDIRPDANGVAMIVGEAERTGRRVDACRGCRVDYQFEVSVPIGTQLDVSTVTDGRIEVAGVGGLISASNVNGPVAVSGLNDCAAIESVNGAVDLVFARAPSKDCNIETVNGEITVGLPAGASLDAILDVTQGDIVSEFDVEPLVMPAKIEKQERNGRHGYRIERHAGVRLGAGGPTFNIASLNGDVRIRRNK